MLKIENLIANYGRIEALHGISLEVREHEIVALIGSNGAGKTTLLNSVSGHVTKEGKIELAGENISKLAPDKIARKGVLHVPEGRHVFPGLTVEQNLLVGTAANKESACPQVIIREIWTMFTIYFRDFWNAGSSWPGPLRRRTADVSYRSGNYGSSQDCLC